MLSDEKRFELQRLQRMGRKAPETPTPRQMIVARTIDPSPWSEHAQEQIDWCARHGLTSSSTHFGAQFILMRRLSLIQADLLLRDLDREANGRTVIPPFDARAVSKRLEKQWWDMHRATHGVHLSKKAVDRVFFMRSTDGLTSPDAILAQDGSVELAWNEEGRRATVCIDINGDAILRIGEEDGSYASLDFLSWHSNAPRLLAEAVDWVHHQGQRPTFIDEDKDKAA